MMAGRLVALLYLFCVLAPGAALAFGSGPAPCLDELTASVVHVDDMTMMASPMRAHSAGHHGGTQNSTVEAADDHGNAPHHGKHCPGPCCAMMCISAMPADLPSMAIALARPISARVFESDRSLRSEAPPRLYRPPIA